MFDCTYVRAHADRTSGSRVFLYSAMKYWKYDDKAYPYDAYIRWDRFDDICVPLMYISWGESYGFTSCYMRESAFDDHSSMNASTYRNISDYINENWWSIVTRVCK